ncbi:MAG: hypothetical protein ACRDGE_07520 [Candidatus Limnocylindria bacterium]
MALAAVAFALPACGESRGANGGASRAEASLEGVSLTIEGAENVRIEATPKQEAGPPRGWSPTLTVDFLVDASKQTVEDPARLTFTIDADLLEGERDPDQLNVFYGALGVTDECEANREAQPDPCIESRSFEADGDARIVVLASRPETD